MAYKPAGNTCVQNVQTLLTLKPGYLKQPPQNDCRWTSHLAPAESRTSQLEAQPVADMPATSTEQGAKWATWRTPPPQPQDAPSPRWCWRSDQALTNAARLTAEEGGAPVLGLSLRHCSQKQTSATTQQGTKAVRGCCQGLIWYQTRKQWVPHTLSISSEFMAVLH